MLTTISFTLLGVRPVLVASLDYTGLGSILAGITALVALYLGHRTSKRTAINTEGVSYVDTNLKTMQATLEWVNKDNAQLRELNEKQRFEIDEIMKELRKVEIKLDNCNRSYELLNKRLNEIGEQNGK